MPADIGNVESLPYADQSYDYVLCSHVLEHTDHPAQAMAELRRVGKRGFVEVPTVMLDFMMQHGETHSRWMCAQIPNGIVFVEKDPSLQSVFTDPEYGKWMYRVTQYGIPLNLEESQTRQFFWRRQDQLNAGLFWNENEKGRVIEVRLDGTICGD